MERDVSIYVSSLQESPQGKNTINYSTRGQLTKDESKSAYSLVYQEQAPGMEGVETTLEIQAQEGTVALLRRGAIQSQQVFKEDKRDLSSYHTPYGQFLVEVFAQQIELDISFDQGYLFLKYELSLNNDPISHNRLTITYKYEA